jgi:ABC-type Fe3+/spermidine/putrescine transport system ATPase subunit
MEVVFEGVFKKYGDFTAVRDLSITIESGALHFLLGPSGCGKTTTLRMLAGLENVTEGKITFDGKDVTKVPAAERGIGMVFQNYALWPHMTVRKNIEYGLKLRKLTKDEINKRIDEVIDFTQLVQFVDRLPGQLSGGQQQRVALARALAIRPNVLLLDEPLSNLDAKLRLEMRDNITRIHRETGITTVYVTHDQKEALSMGTSISVMRAGDMIQTDSPRNLYHNPKTPFIAGFIGETNLILGKYKGKNNGHHLVDTEIGSIEALNAEGSFKTGDPVTLSFRPEAIGIDFGEGGEGNQVATKLDHLTYLGEAEHFHLLGNGESKLKASIFNPPEHSFKSGSTVNAFIAPKDILLLPIQSDMSSGT